MHYVLRTAVAAALLVVPVAASRAATGPAQTVADELLAGWQKSQGKPLATVWVGSGKPATAAEKINSLVNEVAAHLVGKGVMVIDAGAAGKVADEATLRATLGPATPPSKPGSKAAPPSAPQAQAMLLLSLADGNLSGRLVSVTTGEQVATSKAPLSAPASSSAAPKAHDVSDASALKLGSLDVELRRLADRLAQGLGKMGGEVRYQRFAILNFEEAGETTKDKQLGLLVAEELNTLLRRDHNLLMVERAQLNKILDELALGQTGVVDEAKAVEVGKLSGAEALIVGSVSEAGDRYIVQARVVGVDSGAVVVAERGTLPAGDLVALSSEAVVLRTTSGAVFRSILLPGWGQFYNRQEIKGAVFIGLEVIGVGLAIALHVLGDGANRRYSELPPGSDFDAAVEERRGYYLGRNIAIYTTVGIHALNILDAFLFGTTFDSAGSGG